MEGLWLLVSLILCFFFILCVFRQHSSLQVIPIFPHLFHIASFMPKISLALHSLKLVPLVDFDKTMRDALSGSVSRLIPELS